MTVCPIAIVSSCQKCAMFKVCPLKTVLGDHKPGQAVEEKPAPAHKES
jgi:hypothetical protein